MVEGGGSWGWSKDSWGEVGGRQESPGGHVQVETGNEGEGSSFLISYASSPIFSPPARVSREGSLVKGARLRVARTLFEIVGSKMLAELGFCLDRDWGGCALECVWGG